MLIDCGKVFHFVYYIVKVDVLLLRLLCSELFTQQQHWAAYIAE